MEEDLDGEADLDFTEVGPMLTAMRKIETVETGAGPGEYRKAITRRHRTPPAETVPAAESPAPAATAAAPAEETFPHSRGEKRTDRGGTARYPHSKAGARGPSQGNIK